MDGNELPDALEDTLVGPLARFARSLSEAAQWLPDWTVALLLFLGPILVALLAASLLTVFVRRLAGDHDGYVRTLVRRLRGPTRLALVILALSVSIRATPLDPLATARLSHALLIAFIVMVGWAALTVVHVTSDFYLRRFTLDTEDNLLARKHFTQIRILRRAIDTLIVIITVSAALMTFEGVREYGVSLFASAGAAGLVVGLAARPVLSNMIAGIQLAVTQPIRIDDAVVVEGEWGWIQEITGTYVVIRLWDWRRLIVPLSYFIEKPFQNWTREQAAIIGSVFLYVDYTVPVARVREKLEEIARASRLWDGQVVNLQVTNASERTVELRALVSARNSPQTWDLRCEVREKLIDFLQREYPQALPRQRMDVTGWPEGGPHSGSGLVTEAAPRGAPGP